MTDVLAPGTLVARDFRVVRPLSSGGMGSVYVVDQLSTGSQRALKVMHPLLATDAKLRERFEQEARTGARIASEHIVQVITAGVDELTHTPFLVMELLAGEELAVQVARCGALPATAVRSVMAELCHALEAAHRQGIVHRDIKPENIFLAESKRHGGTFTVKLLDFGIAKVVADARTKATQAMGTPFWMAPEQTESGTAITPRTDVWPLGLLAFWMLTGRSFWRSANAEDPSAITALREIALEPIPTPEARAAELGVAGLLPPGFAAWFERCVTREIAARYADAGEAFRALEPLVSGPNAGSSDALANTSAVPILPAAIPTQFAVPAASTDAAPEGRARGTTELAVAAIPRGPTHQGRKKNRAGVFVLGGVGLGAVLLAGVFTLRSGDKPAPQPLTPAGDSIAAAKAACAKNDLKACAMACDSGELPSCVLQAGLAWKAKDRAAVAAPLARACKGGVARACSTLASHLADERVEPALSQDERKARRVSLAVGACEASDGNGCFLEARFTNEGYGIPKDRVEVRKLFKKMISALTRECDANDAQSCLLLGLQYELGKHVAIDPKRAAALYKKACDGGDEGGCAGVKRLAASDEAPAFVKVPGGSFVPGCLSGCSSGAERQVAPFEMSATEISQAQFAVYVQATGAEPKGPCWTRKFLDEEFLTPRADWRFPQAGDEYPVVCVTRSDAMAYAAWLGSKTNSKVRLPSAAEFEFAARSGGQPNAYAWGNEWPPPSGAANIADLSSTLLVYHSYETQSVLTYDDGWTYGAPVGWMNPNALGLHDMTGNVYEWVSDECSARGGSWDSGNGAVLKTTGKMAVPCNGRFTAMGFRVVRDDGP